MKEVALNFWNERDMSNAVVALSKSYRVRTILNTAYTDRPQPFTVAVEVPNTDVRDIREVKDTDVRDVTEAAE